MEWLSFIVSDILDFFEDIFLGIGFFIADIFSGSGGTKSKSKEPEPVNSKDPIFCSRCGKLSSDYNAKYCTNCGNKIR